MVNKTLEKELEELFDLKKARIREAKNLTIEANEAQKDIRLLTLMFRDGIPDVAVPIGNNEMIRWDSHTQQLLVVIDGTTRMIEGTAREVMVRIRPHLSELARKAREFYQV